MGGRTWVETTTGGGSGLNFTVRVGVNTRRRPSAPGLVPRDVTTLRILVIEPRAGDAGEVIGAIRRLGAEAEVARNADDARDKLKAGAQVGGRHTVAIICVDLATRDGVRLAETIAAFEPGLRPPLALLSSAGQRGDASHCRRIGIAAYLTRPLGDTDLHDALRALADPWLASEIRRHGLLTRHYLRELRGRVRVLVVAADETRATGVAERVRAAGHLVETSLPGQPLERVAESRPLLIAALVDGLESAHIAWLRAGRRRLGLLSGPTPALLALGPPGALGEDDAGQLTIPEDADDHELEAAIAQLAAANASREPSGAQDRRRHIDRRALIERLGGDRALVQDVIDLFLRDSERMLSRVREAVAGADGESLVRATDTLKGPFEIFGVRAAVDICARLAAAGGREDFSEVSRLVVRLERISAAIQVELASELAASAGGPTASEHP